MADSMQNRLSMNRFDDESEMEDGLQFLRYALMPKRLDERLLLALWSSANSCMENDPEDPNKVLVYVWFKMLLATMDPPTKKFSQAAWSRVGVAANHALAMEIAGRVAGTRGVAGVDEWCLLEALENLAKCPALTPSSDSV